jgi:hypothetical protein
MRSNKPADPRNAKGAAQGIGQTNDYLYVISGGQFYRLAPSDIKKDAFRINIASPNPADVPIIKALKAMQGLNCPVADLQAPELSSIGTGTTSSGAGTTSSGAGTTSSGAGTTTSSARGPVSASCACIALNIDVFDGALEALPMK